MNLEHEKDIVWLDDRSKYPHLREAPHYPIRGRTKKPSKGDVPGKLIAYATLKPTAKAENPGMFVRRLFYVAAHDPYPAGGPVEAVDPYIPSTQAFPRHG